SETAPVILLSIVAERLKREEPAREAVPTVSPGLGAPAFAALISFAALSVLYVVLASKLWADRLWGAHFYAFFPPAVLIAAASAALLAIGFAAFGRGSFLSPPQPAGPLKLGAQIGISIFAALIARFLFWAYRERHLFWGDALPLSIDI